MLIIVSVAFVEPELQLKFCYHLGKLDITQSPFSFCQFMAGQRWVNNSAVGGLALC